MTDKTKHLIMLSIAGAVFIWSGIKPHDYFAWFLEVVPAIAAFIIVLITYDRFRLTNLVYGLITIHAIILMIGGHWTYAEVPLFNWFRDIGVFSRNNYDKIGHLAQGFIPALAAREILIRASPLKNSKWLQFLSVCVVVALSALYEIIERWVSLGTVAERHFACNLKILAIRPKKLFRLPFR